MTEPIAPTTDEEIAENGLWVSCSCDPYEDPPKHKDCELVFYPRVIARIAADSKTIAELEKEVYEITQANLKVADENWKQVCDLSEENQRLKDRLTEVEENEP
jgi:hypothetical protein